MRQVLGISAFRRLAAASILNELALLIGEIALALLVYRRTGSALGATAFFLCAQFGPAFVSPLLVTRLDRTAARRALAALYALEAGIFLFLAEFVPRLSVPVVLLLALSQASLAISARALSRAAWTVVSSAAGAVRDANAIANSAGSVCVLVGPAIGGGLVALGGTRLPLFVNFLLLVVSTAAVATSRKIPRATVDPAGLAGRLRSVMSYVWQEPVIRRLLLLQASFVVFFMVSIPIELVYARHTLNAGAAGYGLLLSAWGGGAIVGSLIYARWRGVSSRVLITLGAALVGAGVLLMAVAPDLAVGTTGSAIAGMGNGIEVVAMRTALQELAPARSMAIIVSLNESMLQAMLGIGIAVGGGLTALAGPRIGLGVGGGGALAIALGMWIALPNLGVRIPMAAVPGPEHAESDLTVASPRP
jgi:predicted MFS family arabinose efflux permease